VIRTLCIAATLLLAIGLGAARADPETKPEFDPHGAVLCIWSIYLVADKIGEMCFAGQDPEFKEFLDQSIKAMDTFIMENAPATAEQLTAVKRQAREGEIAFMSDRARKEEPGNPDVCTARIFRDGVMIYRRLRDQDREELRTGIVKLLSIPRKPLMNPCL
jgi:hypothetical protein